MSKEKQEEENVLHIGNVSHCEYFTVTPKLRYKKKEIDLGDGTAKTEYRLQQMWQGSGGTENWMWVEYVDWHCG